MNKKDKLEAGLEEMFSKVDEPSQVPDVEALESAPQAATDDIFDEEPEPIDADPQVSDDESDEVLDSSSDEVTATPSESAEPLVAPSFAVDSSDDLEEQRAVQLVVFVLANEHYGVDIATVDQIIELFPITMVPHTPDYIAGLTNLRGTVLPVIDLRKRFGLKAQEPTRETRIVVASINGNKVGLIVDAVTEVRRISELDIEPPSPLVTSVDSTYIVGIAKDNGELIVLLDLEHILSSGGGY